MRVNELAKRAGVTPDTVRFYTRTGLLKPHKNPYNGYKHYGEKDYQRLLFIIKSRHLGFSVGEIKEIIDMSHKGDSPCGRVRHIVRKRIREAQENIDELQRLVSRMEAAAATWDNMPDGEPTGDSVCQLIELWQEPAHEDVEQPGDLTEKTLGDCGHARTQDDKPKKTKGKVLT